LEVLRPDGDWKTAHNLHVLRDADNSGPTPQADEVEREVQKARERRRIAKGIAATVAQLPVSDMQDGLDHIRMSDHTSSTSRGRYQQSWIWKGRVIENHDDPEYLEQVRAEWAQADARRQRWQEEVQLLLREMHRTLLALRYRVRVWTARISTSREDHLPAEVEDGLRIYAAKQVYTARALGQKFASLWRPTVFAAFGQPEWWSSATAWIDSAADCSSPSSSTCDTSPAPSHPLDDGAASKIAFNEYAKQRAAGLRSPDRIRTTKRKRSDTGPDNREPTISHGPVPLSVPATQTHSAEPAAGEGDAEPTAGEAGAEPAAGEAGADLAAGDVSDSELDDPDGEYVDVSDDDDVFSDVEE
jgi:hypothetical protein